MGVLGLSYYLWTAYQEKAFGPMVIQPSEAETVDCRARLNKKSLVSTDQGKANLNLSFLDVTASFDGEKYDYIHKRLFRELGGVGGYIYRGRYCVKSGTECGDACVSYRLEPASSLRQDNHRITTPLKEDAISVEYWFEDDNNNLSKIEMYLKADGNNLVVLKERPYK